MGINTIGAVITDSVLKIELSYLLQKGYIKKGSSLSGKLLWTNGSNVGIETKYTENEKYIRLKYSITENESQVKTNYDYRIELTTLKSNLGRGELLYFVCPVSQSKCRVLYQNNDTAKWQSRQAYKKRIYYRSQQISKNYRKIFAYFQIVEAIENLTNRITKTNYKGKYTKTTNRLIALHEKYQSKIKNEPFQFF